MPVIKVDTNDVVEPYVMPADSECELRIVSYREGTDKNGSDYIMPTVEVVDEIAAKEFTYFIGIPDDNMSPKQRNAATFKYMQFCQAIGVEPAEEQNPEDWIGLEFVAILGVKEDATYGEQNFIKRLVLPA